MNHLDLWGRAFNPQALPPVDLYRHHYGQGSCVQPYWSNDHCYTHVNTPRQPAHPLKNATIHINPAFYPGVPASMTPAANPLVAKRAFINPKFFPSVRDVESQVQPPPTYADVNLVPRKLACPLDASRVSRYKWKKQLSVGKPLMKLSPIKLIHRGQVSLKASKSPRVVKSRFKLIKLVAPAVAHQIRLPSSSVTRSRFKVDHRSVGATKKTVSGSKYRLIRQVHKSHPLSALVRPNRLKWSPMGLNRRASHFSNFKRSLTTPHRRWSLASASNAVKTPRAALKSRTKQKKATQPNKGVKGKRKRYYEDVDGQVKGSVEESDHLTLEDLEEGVPLRRRPIGELPSFITL